MRTLNQVFAMTDGGVPFPDDAPHVIVLDELLLTIPLFLARFPALRCSLTLMI